MRPLLKSQSGFTLVELLVSLVIIAILSVAVSTMLVGAAKTNLFVLNETDAVSQAENALRRIMHNLRTASAISAPATMTSSSTLTLVTQTDPATGNPYTITYTLTGTTLTESDPRYNTSGGSPNTIASNVSAFSVTRNSLSSPQTVTVMITVGTAAPVSRSVTIYCRNL